MILNYGRVPTIIGKEYYFECKVEAKKEMNFRSLAATPQQK